MPLNLPEQAGSRLNLPARDVVVLEFAPERQPKFVRHEGKFVLIKGRSIQGVYGTWDAARVEGLRQYAQQPFFVKQILAEEPVLRVRGYNLPCRP